MTEKTHNKTNSGILKGSVWVGSSGLVVRILGICSTFVLARLLAPEDFGLVAIATSVSGLLAAFSQLNFNQALIRFQDADEQDYSTAFTLNLCRGLLLSVLLLAVAYPVSFALKDERLYYLILVLAVLPLFRGLENPRLLIFEKKMQFDVMFRVMVITKLVGVVVTISLAILLRSYWVLVIGMIVTAVTRSFLTYFYAPGRVSITVKSWRKLLGFSGWLSGADMLGTLTLRANPIILGAFAAPQVVGILSMASHLSYVVFNEVAAPLRRVLFPALSGHEKNPIEFLNLYRQSLAGLFMVLAPISVGLFLTAPVVVPLALGQQWLQAVVPIQCFALALAFSILGRLAPSVVMATGQTRLLFMRNLVMAPITLTLFTVGCAWYGLAGAVFAIVVHVVFETFINMGMASRVTGLGVWRHVTLIKRNLLPLMLMCVVVFLIDHVLIGAVTSPWWLLLKLGIMVSAGASVYGGLLYFVWRMVGRPDGPEATLLGVMHRFYSR